MRAWKREWKNMRKNHAKCVKLDRSDHFDANCGKIRYVSDRLLKCLFGSWCGGMITITCQLKEVFFYIDFFENDGNIVRIFANENSKLFIQII